MSWPQPEELDRLAHDMVAVAWLEGDFVLSSGRRSNHYFDKFLFETQPNILRRVGKQLAHLVPGETQRLAAPELGAVLLGGAVSLELDLPLVIVRKQAKAHGTARDFEGVVTTGGESIRSIEKIQAAGAAVIGLVAVLDREEGGAENLRRLGVPFTPLFRKSDLPIPTPSDR